MRMGGKVTRGTVPLKKMNFSPRFGIAYDPFGDGKTSIRAAAGIFFGSVSGNEWNSTSNYNPFSARQQFNDVKSLTDPYGNLPGGISPYPYVFNRDKPAFIFPASVEGISLDYRWPYSYQLNFSVQRQVTGSLSLTAAYVGTMARRLPFMVDQNYPIYNATATSTNVNNRRPIQPGVLSQILLVKSIMSASYNGFQLSGEKRMSRRWALKSFYTFSKSLTGAQVQNNTTGGGAEDYKNLSLEKGRSDFDRRHNSVSSLLWQPDYFDTWHPVARAVLNGWTVSSIMTFRSGAPFTVTAGQDVNLDGINNDRANVLGNPRLDPNRTRAAASAMWFNTAAFSRPATGTDGNAARNLLDGPGLHNIDLGVFRNFKIRERLKLQARAEITNVFNLVNLSNPNGTFNSSLFGTIRTAGAMRESQMGLRLVW